jgi:hydroxymethylpyrimidine/phosphomethylpyrimidine kinase
MNQTPKGKPVVLAIAGHDPCGGAGIQADIEAVGAAGCHAVTVITSLTAQNTERVGSVRHQDFDSFS